MCRSAKSSCRGRSLSICREEAAADVLRVRAAELGDAPRTLRPSFQTTRLPSRRCPRGAPGCTDLAKKIPQDLAQLCISGNFASQVCGMWWTALDLPSFLPSVRRSVRPPLWPRCATQSANSFKLLSLYNGTVAQARTNRGAAAA